MSALLDLAPAGLVVFAVAAAVGYERTRRLGAGGRRRRRGRRA